MTTVNQLEAEYKNLKSLENSISGIFKLKRMLLESDNKEIVKYHIDLIMNEDNDYLRKNFISFFKNRNDKLICETVLKSELNSGISSKANTLHLLGSVRTPNAASILSNYITSEDREVRYKSIIGLGWNGKEEDLETLCNQMKSDKDGQLRGYCATAMRQIWLKDESLAKNITKCISNAIGDESDEEALTGMIITIQEIHTKKLGIKESDYGDVSGDVMKAKTKTIDFLNSL